MEKPMQYAYEIYRRRSFSRAAETLYISQPALSAIIRRLEEDLGVSLFDRSTKPVSLTPEGEYYMACAERIMEVETGMRQYFDDIRAHKKGSIRIGASSYFCSSILPAMLNAFRRDYPHISLSVTESNATPRLKELLTCKEIDFALTSNTYPPDEYDMYPLADEHIILAVPADAPVNRTLPGCGFTYAEVLAHLTGAEGAPAPEPVSPAAFAGESFITIDRISDLYPRILNMFRACGVTPRIVCHLEQMASCYYMASNGFGSAFLRESTLLTVRDTGNLLFYYLDSPLSVRPTRLYCRKGAYVTKAMQAFIGWVGSVYAGA